MTVLHFARHGRACPGHPRPCLTSKTWMPGTSPGMTEKNENSQPHLPACQILHDLLAAAADGVDLDLAVDALDLDAAHIAGAAKNLHRLGSAERHGLRGL